MPRFKPIRQTRISEEVAEQLKRSIITGNFKEGDKLPSERDLAEEFQVSRVAIHEAMRSLEISGFIETRQGPAGGSYVTELTFERSVNAFQDLYAAEKISIPEILHVRRVVEAEVARLAARNITPEYAQRLKDALEIEELPVQPLSVSEDMDRKMAVHFILAEMSGNRFLEALVRSLMGLIRITVKTIAEAGEDGVFRLHPAGMHHPIVDAVIAGDASAAARAAKEHAIEFGDNLSKLEKSYREKKMRLLSQSDKIVTGNSPF
ncbi:MAG: FadR family transcriptional regulator [Syntrophus sp. (in: bacteria)]|nr:FadR family transcriptional regulator [Syntrophus sp. (in: bacteria)]